MRITAPQLHVQGPWRVCHTKFDGEVIGFHITADPLGSLRPIVEAPGGWSPDEYLAHGRVIAAAPQMLAALRDVSEFCKQRGGRWSEIEATISAALAAAEGR